MFLRNNNLQHSLTKPTQVRHLQCQSENEHSNKLTEAKIFIAKNIRFDALDKYSYIILMKTLSCMNERPEWSRKHDVLVNPAAVLSNHQASSTLRCWF